MLVEKWIKSTVLVFSLTFYGLFSLESTPVSTNSHCKTTVVLGVISNYGFIHERKGNGSQHN